MEDHGVDIGPQEVNANSVALVGGVGAIVVVVLIVLTHLFFLWMQQTILADKGLAEPNADFAVHVAPQNAKLSEYRFIDDGKKKVSLPIARAKSLVIEDRRKNPEGPSGPPKMPTGTAAPADAAPKKKE